MEISAKMFVTGLVLIIFGGVGWAATMDLSIKEKIAKSVMFIGVMCVLAAIMTKIWI